ncbi:MAG: glycosyl hydrolase [Chloroflexota bacterium]|nr:glycosyl hydrolase [Chloroflexota bacterium]
MSDSHELDLDGLLRWRCIGPFRGGRVVAVAGCPDDANTYYFGAVAGGVWKTTDGGIYWHPVSDGFFSTSSVGALAVAPSDANVLYAGMGETTIRIDVSHGDGVYRSTDAGRTWAHAGLRETRHIGKVRVHPDNPDVLWVAALGHAFGPNPERGVFKSDDGGATWRHVLFVSDKAGAVDLSLDETNPRILYAAIWEAHRSFWQISSGGPGSGLWRSQDGGETWENLSDRPNLPSGTLGKIGVVASPAQAGRVWALIEHAKEGGLYRSDDHGEHWVKVSDDQNLISRAWYYMHLTADPHDADTVYVNNFKLWKSSDGGKTFTDIATPHGDNHDLWIDPRNNRRMVQGNDGGANVSVNGGYSWSTIFNQSTAQFYHLAVDGRVPYTLYGTQQDNSSIAVPSRTNHGAITWADCFIAGTGESGYIAVRPDDPEIVYVGAIGSSPGGGNSLQRYDRRTDQIRLITTWPEEMGGYGAGEHKQRFAWTYPIVISPHDPGTLYVGGDRVFKSTDEGQSWAAISPDLTRSDPITLEPTGGPVNRDAIGAETYATVFAFTESPHQAGLLWAGTDDGRLHLSHDGGGAWEEITPPDLPEWTMISGIEPSPFDAATVYVAATRYKLDDYRPYLYVTHDFGEHWSRIDAGIPQDDFTRVIRADPTQAGLLYAGTETGLYVSFDDGAHWQRFQLNLPVAPIHDVLIKGSDLIAGTHGRSIWILDDLSPLRAYAAGVPAGEPYLFAPRETKRVLPGIDWGDDVAGSTNYLSTRPGGYTTRTSTDGETIRTYLDVGENPPSGVVVTYRLVSVPEDPIALVFSDAKGEEVRAFSSRKPDDEPQAKERRVPAQTGWNRFVWDMRHAPAAKIEGADPASKNPISGPFVVPGEYTVTLTIGETKLTQPFRIVIPDNIPAVQSDLEAQHELLLRIHQQVDRTTTAINQMRDLRAQLDGWAKRTRDRDEGAEVAAAAETLRDAVHEIEKTLLVADLRSDWETYNHGVRLLDKLVTLSNDVALGDYRPTDVSDEVFVEVKSRIDEQIASFARLLAEDLPAFNKRLAKAKLDAVLVT